MHLWNLSNKGSQLVVSEEIIIRDYLAQIQCLTWSPADPLEFVTGCDDGFVCVWRIIEVKSKFSVQLVWGTLASHLTATGTLIDQVEGLTDMQKKLLVQRDAIDRSAGKDTKPSPGTLKNKKDPWGLISSRGRFWDSTWCSRSDSRLLHG